MNFKISHRTITYDRNYPPLEEIEKIPLFKKKAGFYYAEGFLNRVMTHNTGRIRSGAAWFHRP